MRALLLGAISVLSLAPGCGKNESAPTPKPVEETDKAAADKPAADKPAADKPPADKPPADKAPAEKPPADKAPADKPVADKPPAADYETLMKEGAALEDQKKWSDALAKFEAALVAKADDPRALAEIGFSAYFAGNLERAKEATTAAVLATKDDKLRGALLFNLGLAVERTMPNAAASLDVAALAIRPSAVVRARLAKLMQNKDAATPTPDGDALLAKVGVTPPAADTLPPTRSAASAADQALMTALERAGIEWELGAAKAMLVVTDVECRETHEEKATSYECTKPAVKGRAAQEIVEGLAVRKIEATKDGDAMVYKVGAIRCRSFTEGDSGADDCDVTK